MMRVLTRPRSTVAVIAACFFLRAAFYCLSYPIWEGYDEWSHYAVLERVAFGHDLLVGRDLQVSQDIAASLKLVPLPWQMQNSPAPSVVHDDFWRLSAGQREERLRSFEKLFAQASGDDPQTTFRAYEALQPPLYYWLMAPLLALGQGLKLSSAILLLRLAGCALATLTIPLVYKIARSTFDSTPISLGCAAIVALMPEYCIDVARVGNEALAVPLFTALTWLAVDAYALGFNRRRALVLGCVLGLGLLTKVYFLTALPALILLFLRACRARKLSFGNALSKAALIFLVAGSISGWWYVRNLRMTSTLSGLSESVLIHSLTTVEFLGKAVQTDFRSGVDAILFSHLWFGAWSALTVRSWMYHLLYGVVLLAGIGLIRIRFRGVAATAALYATFWLGLLYNVVLLFVARGFSTCMGWYLYAAVGAEIVLCWRGLHALVPARHSRWIAPLGVSLFGLLDLYTVHAISLPYYAGVIAHRTNGSLAALHSGDVDRVGLWTAIERLGAFHGGWGTPAILLTSWALYLLSTLTLIGLGFRFGRPPVDGTSRRDSALQDIGAEDSLLRLP